MTCNRCLQEIIEGESFWEDEAEGTAYHNDCRRAAIDRRNKAEDERAAALARAEAAEHQLGEVREGLADARKTAAVERERVRALVQRVAELQGGEDVMATETFTEYLDAACRGSLSAYYEAQSVYRTTLARAAGLEAQLAAQGWRPGSETPPPDWYQTAETIDGVFSHAYFDGAVWQGYPDNYPPMWYRPIPPLPAPDAQEPTP